jgi:hypothetical protein
LSFTRLLSIVIPASVEVVHGSALSDCALANVEVASGNRHFSTDESFLYRDGETVVVRFFGSQGTVRIPKKIIIVGESAFYRCRLLERIEVEARSQMRRIEKKAFAKTALTGIVLPPTVAVIGRKAFNPLCQVTRDGAADKRFDQWNSCRLTDDNAVLE